MVLCLALGLVHLVANWWAVVVSLPGVRLAQAGVANLAGAAVSNSLPEGGAVGTALTYGIFHSWGFGTDAVTASLMATGVWSQFVRYSLLSGALVVVAAEAGHAGWVAAAVGLAGLVALAVWLFVAAIGSEPFARRIGGIADRGLGPILHRLHRGPPGATHWVLGMRSELVDVVHDRGRRLTAATLAGQLSAVLVLVAALRSMGIGPDEVSWALAIVAYGGASLVSMVAPTPGGVGVAEAALLAVLGPAVPSSDDAALTAAVVLYRMATWLLPTLLGIPAYLFWRHTGTWRVEQPSG